MGLHRLRLREPAQKLAIEFLDGIDRHMVSHAARPDLLNPGNASRPDLVISEEAHTKVVPPYSHATKVVPADQVDVRLDGIHTQGSSPRQRSAQ